MRTLSILGSTGSIGTSALDLIERLNAAGGEPRFQVAALAAHTRSDLLIEQIRRFRPALACIGSEEAAATIRDAIGGLPTRVVPGRRGLLEAATLPGVDFVLAAIVGAAGLEPTFAAVKAGRSVGLANKEALVLAGELMISAARESGGVLLPVDSEHNALHQCLRGEQTREVRRLVMTASGGPFSRQPGRDLSRVTPEEALAHPTWVMGPRITIDSATLMNKGLEIIEAHWLFGIPEERIDVVVHPQSIIHSLVEFVDGSFVCQMGAADMRHPIQYALTWPDRIPTPLEPVDLSRLPALTFEPPDERRFPCLTLGRDALKAGGTMPAVLNAANEVAVQAFLEGSILFTDIPRIIRATMDGHRPVPAASLDVILEADAWSRRTAGTNVRPGAGALNRSGGRS